MSGVSSRAELGVQAGLGRIARDARSSMPRAFARLLTAMLMGFMLVSCSNDEDNWSYVGLRQVWVDSIMAPSTLGAADTLSVILDGWGGCGQPEFSHVETVRDSSQVDFTVWADCYEWSGPGVMPPTDISVRCEHKVPPPFYPGPLLLVAHRPDNSTVGDTILVVP